MGRDEDCVGRRAMGIEVRGGGEEDRREDGGTVRELIPGSGRSEVSGGERM